MLHSERAESSQFGTPGTQSESLARSEGPANGRPKFRSISEHAARPDHGASCDSRHLCGGSARNLRSPRRRPSACRSDHLARETANAARRKKAFSRCGLPSSTSSRLRTVATLIRSSASDVTPARCGETIRFFRPTSGMFRHVQVRDWLASARHPMLSDLA